MDLDLVDQSRPEVLLPDFRAAHDVDVLVPGGCLRLLQGALDCTQPPTGPGNSFH
jgi:hypothetical protein